MAEEYDQIVYEPPEIYDLADIGIQAEGGTCKSNGGTASRCDGSGSTAG